MFNLKKNGNSINGIETINEQNRAEKKIPSIDINRYIQDLNQNENAQNQNNRINIEADIDEL